MPSLASRSFSTLVVHSGDETDPATGAIVAPIHQTTTFVQEGVGRDKGHTYSRSSNPTVAVLDRFHSSQRGTTHSFRRRGVRSHRNVCALRRFNYELQLFE